MTISDNASSSTAPRRWRVTSTAVVGGLVALAAALAAWLWWLADDDSAGPDVGISVEDVADDRFDDTLIGERVTISGEVAAALLPEKVFWVGDGFGDPSVLVVASTAVPGLEEGLLVRVTGTVVDIEDSGLLDQLDPSETDVGADFGRYEDQNVVADATVVVLDRE